MKKYKRQITMKRCSALLGIKENTNYNNSEIDSHLSHCSRFKIMIIPTAGVGTEKQAPPRSPIVAGRTVNWNIFWNCNLATCIRRLKNIHAFWPLKIHS